MNTEPNRDHSALDLDCAKLFYARLPMPKTDTEMMLEHERTIEKLKARLSEAERVMEMTYNLMVSECYCDNRDATEYKDIVAAYEAYKATVEGKSK